MIDFDFTSQGLTVKFLNFATEDLDPDYPNRYAWDFGDGDSSGEVNPVHTYESAGRYPVTLRVISGEESESSSQVVVVSDIVHTTLSGSIYQLIDTYLPKTLFPEMNMKVKRQFIQKWQLYIQPLVNHEIPIEEYSNELYYEALENQLIMELAAYDYMVVYVNQVIQKNLVITGQSGSSSEEESEGGVKKIVTGPSEVEYFDVAKQSSDTVSAFAKVTQPGGVLDMLKQEICMLASRLDIYIPICDELPSKNIVPRVINRRRQGFLDGPDPFEVVNK